MPKLHCGLNKKFKRNKTIQVIKNYLVLLVNLIQLVNIETY